jgi:DNA-binding NtrC family response regulator
VGGISDEAIRILNAYEYPGNVRELENIMERAITLANGRSIEPRHLPLDLQQLALRCSVHRKNFLAWMKMKGSTSSGSSNM